MPIPLLPSIIGSIIEGVVDQAPAPPAADVAQQQAIVGQVRTLPAGSLGGILNAAVIGSVQIDGKTLPLAPGAQIRNPANMIVLPTMIQQDVPVRYLVDGMGYVSRIWILSPAELAASR
ncbi:MAG TPA: hypothetical protein VFK72_09185 [Nevskia sp.]|nr:hypothetical protein [Nevskia sp.]